MHRSTHECRPYWCKRFRLRRRSPARSPRGQRRRPVANMRPTGHARPGRRKVRSNPSRVDSHTAGIASTAHVDGRGRGRCVADTSRRRPTLISGRSCFVDSFRSSWQCGAGDARVRGMASRARGGPATASHARRRTPGDSSCGVWPISGRITLSQSGLSASALRAAATGTQSIAVAVHQQYRHVDALQAAPDSAANGRPAGTRPHAGASRRPWNWRRTRRSSRSPMSSRHSPCRAPEFPVFSARHGRWQ
jgi:hypothetical protein